MRITINSFGSRGDIQPYVALGKGLQAAGHTVRILSHAIYEDFIREYDLDFHPIPLDPREVLLDTAFADFGNNFPAFMRFLREQYSVGLEMIFRVTDEAAEDADLLLNSSLSFAGYHVAEKRNIPAIAAYLQPSLPTHAFHNMGGSPPPRWLPFKGVYNYMSHKLVNQIFFNVLRPLTNECRASVLDLPPLSAAYYWRVDTDGVSPIMYGYSPSVIPKPPDWGDNVDVTGYWFLDQPGDYKPPGELTAFLDSGPPPVYIGFGSMVDHEREEILNLVVEALEIAQSRAILLGGWSELGGEALPDHIFQIDYAPHDWLFPHMAAVIHHGGAGTAAAGFRAGVPSIIVPFFGDQYFWAWWAKELRVGPQAPSRQKLSAASLAEAIQQATQDEGIKQHAAALGKRIRAEDGIANAIDFIEGYMREL